MMAFSKIDQWMEEWKRGRIEELRDVQLLRAEMKQAQKEQRTVRVEGHESEYHEQPYVVLPEFRHYSYLKITPKYELREPTSGRRFDTEKHLIGYLQIRGMEFPIDLVGYPEMFNFEESVMKAFKHSVSDYKLFDIQRNDDYIEKLAEKEKNTRRLQIEKAVEKICGAVLDGGSDVPDGIMVRGSNGRVAHVFAIRAGGWNIQRAHIRVLIKEI